MTDTISIEIACSTLSDGSKAYAVLVMAKPGGSLCLQIECVSEAAALRVSEILKRLFASDDIFDADPYV